LTGEFPVTLFEHRAQLAVAPASCATGNGLDHGVRRYRGPRSATTEDFLNFLRHRIYLSIA